jgi:23S rRNA (cytidine1920-2'-O)/16S rRNA (cytidine1409-2'-O)-methyltransferase
MLLYFGSATMLPAGAHSMCDIDHRAVPEFVSRGGIKLENVLTAIGLDVSGRDALDVGACTGGFTDCLLKRGARHVIALDVGYGQLDWGLRNDASVTVLERTNARHLTLEMLPYAPDLATIDVSFISLKLILPAVLACMATRERYDVLALIKPQFEVGRELASRGRGVIRDADARRGALVEVGRAARALGASVLGYSYSGLPGPKGNRETFIHLAEPSRTDGVFGANVAGSNESGEEEQLVRMAYAAEPA